MAVLAQAAEVAARQGLGALTIGDLAARTHLSKSGLFAHFQSKEVLQLDVLAYARDRFVDEVIRPATRAPRGEARVRALFEHWAVVGRQGHAECLFVSAAAEFDDQPGPVRDQLVRDHRDFIDSIAQMFRTGIAEGEFRPDADPEQFAFELHGIMLGYFHAHRLLQDPRAGERTRRAFETVLADYRIAPPPAEPDSAESPAPAVAAARS
ncbi:TetR/AcrR family transcriptional regulator [Actinospica durhamensis]|uniref:TetR/AcrR family transcriptional regulator n=2 Tax=Actinospica durhamensis TaxID=1508375 RepID=A0A941ISR6_9ACTN|nr:TetR/AcrR family transcriptional regulator [Actinospica durhamensis]